MNGVIRRVNIAVLFLMTCMGLVVTGQSIHEQDPFAPVPMHESRSRGALSVSQRDLIDQTVASQPVQEQDGVVSMEKLEQAALACDAGIRSLQADRECIIAELAGVGAWRDPEFRGRYNREHQSPSGIDQDEYRTGLRFYIPNIRAASARRNALQAALQAKDRMLEATQWDVRMRVREQIATLEYLYRKKSIMEVLQQAKDSYSRSQQHRHQSGEATTVAFLRDALDTANTFSEYQQVCAEIDHVRSILVQCCGIDALQPVTFDQQSIQRLIAACDHRETLVETVWAHHPALKNAQAQGRQSVAEQQAENRENSAWLQHIGAAYQWENNGGAETWFLEAALTLPVFSAFQSYPGKRYAAEVSRQEIKTADLRKTLKKQITAAARKLCNCHTDNQEYRRRVLPLLAEMEQMLKVMQVQKAVNRRALLELQEQISTARLHLLEMEYREQMAAVDLQKLMGGTLEYEHGL
jgi:hypothetical protein